MTSPSQSYGGAESWRVVARDLGRLNPAAAAHFGQRRVRDARAPPRTPSYRKRQKARIDGRVLRERVSRAPVDPKVTSSPPDPASARRISVRARTVFLAQSSWVTSTAMAELMEAPVEGAVEEWQEGMEAAGPLPLQTLEVRVLALYARATLDHAHPRGTRQSRHPPFQNLSLSRSSPSPSRRSTASRRPTSRNFWRRAFTPSRVSRMPRRRA